MKQPSKREIEIANKAAHAMIVNAIDMIGDAFDKETEASFDRCNRVLALALAFALGEGTNIDRRIGPLAAKSFLEGINKIN
jgi:hypothetical protein